MLGDMAERAIVDQSSELRFLFDKEEERSVARFAGTYLPFAQ